MDPMSITVSIVALIGAGGSIAKGLRRLVSLKDAPDALLQLNNAVSDVHMMVSAIQDCCRYRHDHLLTIDEPVIVSSALERAKDLVLELERFIAYELTKVAAKGDEVDKIAWFRAENKVCKLKDRLRDVKLDLGTATNILNLSRTLQLETRMIQLHVVGNQAFQQLHEQQSFGYSKQDNQNQIEIPTSIEQSETVITTPEPSHFNDPMAEVSVAQTSVMDASTTYTPSHRPLIFNITKGRSCSPLCLCSCHQRTQIRTPTSLHHLFGALSITYNYSPFVQGKCDNLTCKRQSSAIAKSTYAFPGWFVRRVIAIHAVYTHARGPELLLRVLRRRPTGTAIFIAVQRGSINQVQNLLDHGEASILDVDELGESLLLLAVDCSRYDLIGILLAAGADAAQEDDWGRTPYTVAWQITRILHLKKSDLEPLFELTRTNPDLERFPMSELHAALRGWGSTSLDTAIAAMPRESINQLDQAGRTALSLAAELGDVDIVRKLLQKGADPRIADRLSRTPLHYWAMGLLGDEGVYDEMLELLECQDNINRVDCDGRTALHSACGSLRLTISVLARLKAFGADINVQEVDGMTALRYMILVHVRPAKVISVIDWLIDNGADSSIQDRDGHTPVMLTLFYQENRVLELLLARGAAYRLNTFHGENVLHFAALFGTTESLRVLQKAGITLQTPNSKVPEGWTPMELAEWRRDYNTEWVDRLFCEPDEDPQKWFEAFETLYQSVEERSRATDWTTSSDSVPEADTQEEAHGHLPGSFPDD